MSGSCQAPLKATERFRQKNVLCLPPAWESNVNGLHLAYFSLFLQIIFIATVI